MNKSDIEEFSYQTSMPFILHILMEADVRLESLDNNCHHLSHGSKLDMHYRLRESNPPTKRLDDDNWEHALTYSCSPFLLIGNLAEYNMIAATSET